MRSHMARPDVDNTEREPFIMPPVTRTVMLFIAWMFAGLAVLLFVISIVLFIRAGEMDVIVGIGAIIASAASVGASVGFKQFVKRAS
jgi:hypothetical protein